jgi:NadR type nicotinamide-nucleotide adenylyltransferase
MNTDLLPEVSVLKKVAIVGPECTGKTSLAEALAEHYQTEWVREYARGYLDKFAVPYVREDLVRIAQGQMRIEDEFVRDAKRVLVCDTNLVVIKIWSEFKFKAVDPWIVDELTKRKYDLHLLTQIDVPWVADPQREHPDHREELYALYKQELISMNVPFVEISGDEVVRLQSAITAVDKLLVNG